MALASPKSSSFAIGGADSPAAADEEDVAGRQITMHDAGAVSSVECRRHLDRELERARNRQRPLGQSRRQRLALQEFHDQEVDALFMPDVVQCADMRMIEGGNGARFAFEAFARLRIVVDARQQHLDRDGPVQPRVARLVHFAHAAGAKRRDHLVGADATAGDENLMRRASDPSTLAGRQDDPQEGAHERWAACRRCWHPRRPRSTVTGPHDTTRHRLRSRRPERRRARRPAVLEPPETAPSLAAIARQS